MLLYDLFSKLDNSIRNMFQGLWDSADSRGGCARLLSWLLIFPSWLYGGVQRVRRNLYGKGIITQHHFLVPVISIGGLRVGGSGKTPFAVWMAGRLRARGLNVVLLTRGYRRKGKSGSLVISGSVLDRFSPDVCGDEPYMLCRSLPDVPIAIDGNRFRAGLEAMRSFPVDVFLLDDGFQHLALARECDIVLVKQGEDPRTMDCLPRGPLRETSSALREADLIIEMTTSGLQEEERRKAAPGDYEFGGRPAVFSAALDPGGLYRLDDDCPVDPGELRGGRILAFCGIARPSGFFASLANQGLGASVRRVFPDHHRFDGQDHRELMSLLGDVQWAITTEKDAVKIRSFSWPARKILVLRLEMKMNDESEFWKSLEALGVLPERPTVRT